ncbi:MAG: hypothetical protein H0V09_03515 [Gemmatimonadetes bacterium]|nr:hypothetical protein [Gemmatimonadota bacterium]
MPRSTQKPTRESATRRRTAGEPQGARIAFGRVNYALFAAAVVVIALGYVLLGRGSITLAPILLILGYVVLIPAGILLRSNTPGE